MTPDDLEILIQEGEGTTLEFKESLSSSFARELVALANTIGGRILLGVRDDGAVVGDPARSSTIPKTSTARSTKRGCSSPASQAARPATHRERPRNSWC